MSKISRTDVTAVKLYENCILTGIGSWINVFDRKSATLIQKIHALEGQKVYGFILNNNDVLVYGGKQFTVVRRENANNFVKSFNAILCDDWMHSGTWLDAEHVALLTAHNVVQKWNILNKSLVSQYASKENSILYSGHLLPIQGDILVFCGTVFSEVLIHRCGSDTVLHRLRGHKGVIFSVSCCLQRGIIVTTSDDRSVRIWQHSSITNCLVDSIDYWENVNITCTHELYGHLARVMRNCITNDYIISIGEDSNICFWSSDGAVRKITAHQNASIWSMDVDDKSLVTGGSDSSIILHPLSIVTDYSQNEVVDIKIVNPKRVVFTSRRNIVVMSDKDNLVYYDATTKAVTTFNLKHESTYKLLSISSCKQIIAVVDMFGKLDIFIESCKGPPSIKNIIDEKLQIGNILFMQWVGNRHLVFSSENGAITVLASRSNVTEVYTNFVLPPCKERWLTSAALDNSNNMLVVGDRCGSIHVYVAGQQNPLKTFKKVHGRYGPTSITFRKSGFVTTGRDGTLKYFRIDNWNVKLMCSQHFEFQWVEKFADKDEHYICGFHERTFVVYDISNNNKVLEVSCGGGHRSWDIIRYIDKLDDDTYEEFIKLIYLKNSNMNVETFKMGNVISKTIVNGTHSKEINCLKTYTSDLDTSVTFLITGGEDTSLRISRINLSNDFHDEAIFKQLSSVRTLDLIPISNDKVFIISGGGRAQICIKLLQFGKDGDILNVCTEELVDYLIKGTDKERKGNQTWRNCTIDIDPETRVMDLDVFKSDASNFIIIAGCSDARLRVFHFNYDKNSTFKLIHELLHHNTCILKTVIIEFHNKKMLISCTTRGIATLWEIANTNDIKNICFNPIESFSLQKSGINSLGCSVISDTSILLASGGDDNTVNLNVIEINGSKTAVLHNWSSDKLHCSQITGLAFTENYIVSTSIDQRVTLLKWNVQEGIKCEFVSQVFSDVADIQGLEILKYDSESITVCVFGKGFEIILIPKSSKR